MRFPVPSKKERVDLMAIAYTEEKKFTKEQVEALFLSVGWVFGQYPQRLFKALMHSSTVLTAWDGEELVGDLSGCWTTVSWWHICTTFWCVRIIRGRESPGR